MNRSWIAAALALTLCAGARAGETQHIVYAESIQLDANVLDTARKAKAAASFQAHGRQFDLALESNERLLDALDTRTRASLADLELLRGRIKGNSRSWVRLTRNRGALQGMIWDGTEMFVIEPAAAVASRLLSPVQQTGPARSAGDSTVMYRLADVQGEAESSACMVLEPDGSGSSAQAKSAARSYDTLVQELQASASASATVRMEVAVIGDNEYFNENADPRATALTRMNVVDGMFSEQVGVRLAFTVVRFFETAADGLDQDDPTGLINLLADHKESSPDIRDRGVAHLLTGRNLSGSTVGIAYRGSMCHPRYGVSLSESGLTFASSTLVIAHEIGHNFGAPHDVESGSPCSTTSTGFVMSPQLSEGGNQFSQCSLSQIRPVLSAAPASCVTSLDVRDAAVAVTPSTRDGVPGQAFSYPIDVTAVGTHPISDVIVTATLPDTITLVSGEVPGGSCAAGGGGVTCSLGVLEGNSTRRIELSVMASALGSFPSDVTLVASDDANGTNNSVPVVLRIAQTLPAPRPAPGGNNKAEVSSGGGELGWLALLALLAPLAARWLQAVRSRISSSGTGSPIAKPCA